MGLKEEAIRNEVFLITCREEHDTMVYHGIVNFDESDTYNFQQANIIFPFPYIH